MTLDPIRAAGADDPAALRDLVYARVLAIADDACTCACPERARARAGQFQLILRSMSADPALTDLYERLLPQRERVERRLASG